MLSLMNRAPRPLWSLGLLLACGVIPEVILLFADIGVWGTPRWRPDAYQYAAFYSGLLRDWQANYDLQPVVMYVSYWLFHADIVHMAGNMIALTWLWFAIRGQINGFVLLVVYLASAIGGGIAFGLLNAGYQPMIGASGAIFGLAGLWVALERNRQGDSWAIGVTCILVSLNSLIWILEQGQLAWESHLGGFVVGAAIGLLWSARQRPRPKDGPEARS